jgi:hypothetical protein
MSHLSSAINPWHNFAVFRTCEKSVLFHSAVRFLAIVPNTDVYVHHRPESPNTARLVSGNDDSKEVATRPRCVSNWQACRALC